MALGHGFHGLVDLVLAPDKVFCQPLPAGWNSSARNIHMQGQSISSN
jgi:hypothetical protein